MGELWQGPLAGLVVAFGVGLLIGVERERSKGTGPERGSAGVRTFALVALLGATVGTFGSAALVAVFGAATALIAVAAYVRSRAADPGITSEVALVLTYAIGVLASRFAQLAAGLGVLVALVLASRSWLHELVAKRLSDLEVLDGLLLAGSALIILPLLPDRALDPYGVVNPQLVWRLTVLVLAINAAGYVAERTLGAARGLAVAGFFGGFVSSAATIGAMGVRSREHPAAAPAAVAGAALSSVATVIQLGMVVAVANPALLRPLLPALVLAGLAAVVYGAAFAWRAARQPDGAGPSLPGRAFQPREALLFAALVTVVLFVGAWLADRFGELGALGGIALAGFADTHSAAASAAALVGAGAVGERVALLAVLGAATTNTLTKASVALAIGGWPYARQLWPGLAALLTGLWVGLLPRLL